MSLIVILNAVKNLRYFVIAQYDMTQEQDDTILLWLKTFERVQDF